MSDSLNISLEQEYTMQLSIQIYVYNVANKSPIGCS